MTVSITRVPTLKFDTGVKYTLNRCCVGLLTHPDAVLRLFMSILSSVAFRTIVVCKINKIPVSLSNLFKNESHHMALLYILEF